MDLYLAGWALSVAGGSRQSGDGIFSHRIYCLDGIPTWFSATMALVFANSLYLYKWALLRGSLQAPGLGNAGEFSMNVPLPHMKMVAINLVTIPLLMVALLVVESAHL